MPRLASTLLRLLLATGIAAWSLCSAARAAADPVVPGEILVKLKSTAALPDLLSRYSLGLKSQFGARPIYRLQTIGTLDTKAALDGLKLEPSVLAAEPNLIHRSPEARKNQPWAIGDPAAYALQWAPQALRLTRAHALSQGAGTRVAVLDTGIDASHPAFAGRLLPGLDFVDQDLDPSEAIDPLSPGYGHGTHVAGLIALGAPAASIMPLRVLDAEGAGNVWVLAEALLHAVDPDHNPATNDGAQVINLSLGTLTRTRVLDAVATLATCGVPEPADKLNDQSDPGYNGDKLRCAAFGGAVIVAAAGNDGSATVREYPAAEGVYGMLAVSASTAANRLAPFANSGGWIDLAAPGEGITSTFPLNAPNSSGYATWSGTSMAAALASASVALLRAREPALLPVGVVRRLVLSAAPLCGSKLTQLDIVAALGGTPASVVACP